MMLMSRNRFIVCSLAVLGALVMALVGLPGRNHSDLNLPAVYGETPCYKPVVPMAVSYTHLTLPTILLV